MTAMMRSGLMIVLPIFSQRSAMVHPPLGWRVSKPTRATRGYRSHNPRDEGPGRWSAARPGDVARWAGWQPQGVGDRQGRVVAAGDPARQTQDGPTGARRLGAGGRRPMERSGEQRPHWGRMAL